MYDGAAILPFIPRAYIFVLKKKEKRRAYILVAMKSKSTGYIYIWGGVERGEVEYTLSLHGIRRGG